MTTMDDQVAHETAPLVANMMVSEVTKLGLCAEQFGDTMVWIHNRAADPPAGINPHTRRLNPGLRQIVQLRMFEDGFAGWFWVWHAPGEQPDYEYIAPASEVVEVAARVAIVLAVRTEAMS